MDDERGIHDMEQRQNALMVVDESQALAVAERIMPKFPKDCTKAQALEVARIALAYQLDPFLGELIPYQGNPYITIAGRIRLADMNPNYDGYDLEPASEAEIRALRADASESVWKCSVYRKDRRRPTVAFGRAGGKAETNPVARRWEPELAQKRAMHRALRAAFPAPIPGLEESLTGQQLKAIHAIDNEYGISPDERHEVLADTFDVESSADLTSAQASAYIDAHFAEVDDAPEPDDDPLPSAADSPAHDLATVNMYRRKIEAAGSLDDLREIGAEVADLYGDASPDMLREAYANRQKSLKRGAAVTA